MIKGNSDISYNYLGIYSGPKRAIVLDRSVVWGNGHLHTMGCTFLKASFSNASGASFFSFFYLSVVSIKIHKQ